MSGGKLNRCTHNTCPAFKNIEEGKDIFHDVEDEFHDAKEPEESEKFKPNVERPPGGVYYQRQYQYQEIRANDTSAPQYGGPGTFANSLFHLLSQAPNTQHFRDGLSMLLTTVDDLLNALEGTSVADRNCPIMPVPPGTCPPPQMGPAFPGAPIPMPPMFPPQQLPYVHPPIGMGPSCPPIQMHAYEMEPSFLQPPICEGPTAPITTIAYPSQPPGQIGSPDGTCNTEGYLNSDLFYPPAIPPNTPVEEDIYPQSTTVRSPDGKFMVQLPLIFSMTVDKVDGTTPTFVPIAIRLVRPPSPLNLDSIEAEIPEENYDKETPSKSKDLKYLKDQKDNMDERPRPLRDTSKPIPKPQQKDLNLCVPCACEECPVPLIGSKVPGCPEICGCCSCPYRKTSEIKEEQQKITTCTCKTDGEVTDASGPCNCEPKIDACKCIEAASIYRKAFEAEMQKMNSSSSVPRNADGELDVEKKGSISLKPAKSVEDKESVEQGEIVEDQEARSESKAGSEDAKTAEMKVSPQPCISIFGEKVSGSCLVLLRKICAELSKEEPCESISKFVDKTDSPTKTKSPEGSKGSIKLASDDEGSEKSHSSPVKSDKDAEVKSLSSSYHSEKSNLSKEKSEKEAEAKLLSSSAHADKSRPSEEKSEKGDEVKSHSSSVHSEKSRPSKEKAEQENEVKSVHSSAHSEKSRPSEEKSEKEDEVKSHSSPVHSEKSRPSKEKSEEEDEVKSVPSSDHSEKSRPSEEKSEKEAEVKSHSSSVHSEKSRSSKDKSQKEVYAKPFSSSAHSEKSPPSKDKTEKDRGIRPSRPSKEISEQEYDKTLTRKGRSPSPEKEKSLAKQLENMDVFCAQFEKEMMSRKNKMLSPNSGDYSREPSPRNKPNVYDAALIIKEDLEEICAGSRQKGCGCHGCGRNISKNVSAKKRMEDILNRLNRNGNAQQLNEDELEDIYVSSRQRQKIFHQDTNSEQSDQSRCTSPCPNKRTSYGYSLDNQLKKFEEKTAESPNTMKIFLKDLSKDIKAMKNTLNRGLSSRNPSVLSGCLDPENESDLSLYVKHQPSFPATIRCVRPCGYNALLVTWTIHSFCGLIGYEICVDGCIKARLHSAGHDSACAFGVDVSKKHVVVLHPIPDKSHLKEMKLNKPAKCKLLPDLSRRKLENSVPSLPCSWTPSSYLYDPRHGDNDDGSCCCVNASQK